MKSDVKQVIVVRSDLKMVRGKEDAQCGHAVIAWMACRMQMSNLWYNSDNKPVGVHAKAKFTNVEVEWLSGKNKKVTVVVGSEEELMEIDRRAKEAHILSYVITDEGLTQFNGVPTKTCLALGPDLSEKIDKITGHLKLR